MIRLGVIGCGHRVTCLLTNPFIATEPDIRVAGIVDPNFAYVRQRLEHWGFPGAKDIPSFPDLKTLMRQAKPDALIVGTRCNLHAPLAVQAAKYDVPLFLEKPVAVNDRQALALEKAFAKSRCEVVVSFPLRASPLCELAKQCIRDGDVGKPEHITAINYVTYGHGYFEGTYREYDVTQGLFLQKATHDLDYMMYLMDDRIVRVAGMATFKHVFGGDKPAGLMCSQCDETATCPESPANRVTAGIAGKGKGADHPCLFSKDIGTPEAGMNEDSSSCLVEFASGAHGVYTQVFFPRRDTARRGAIVTGYKGTVSFDWYASELKRVRHFEQVTETKRTDHNAQTHFSGDHELAKDFFGLIHGKIKRSRVPIEAGLASVFTCLAAKKSALTGKFCKVRQVQF